MTTLDAIVLGVVEGLTEFLPVSSTGHLILTAYLLDIPETPFLSTFQIVIQLGAILSVVALYFRRLSRDFELNKRILVALVPALLVGALFYGGIKSLFESQLTVVIALFSGGLLIILFEYLQAKKEKPIQDLSQISYRTAFLIGLWQASAVIPGVSRAGATILGGLLLGLERRVIVEFSFLLAVPTMLAASTIDLYNHAFSFTAGEGVFLAVGFATSFFVAILAIRFFLRFVTTHTFVSFGVYRILVAALFFLLIL